MAIKNALAGNRRTLGIQVFSFIHFISGDSVFWYSKRKLSPT